ncbi:zinc-ribbon domain-containing protein [Xenophilus sp. Marseille-Q4582]|uniref:zinc-ribbon domain-containing protein n=1 Tax=Xenophilus sp. Marseille-Q4582 TaxID=2866600 RepID=UPI001CE45B43|nr:zinc ribbon domain-containing protein [Xenophilus sp. Marseille-Q4582]
MALINCTECGKQVSDKAAACPRCGAPVETPPPAGDGEAYAGTFPDMAEHGAALKKYAAEQKKTKRNFWIGMAFLAAIIIGSCSAGSGKNSGPSAPRAFDSSDALVMCQMALKRIARDPDKAEIPYVVDHGSGDEAYFAWGNSTKMARMRNGLGLDVATTASCTVSKSQKRITSLTLDGKTIL